MGSDLLNKLEPFFREYKPLFYRKGQVIVHPQDEINSVYFIEKGYVKFYFISQNGKEITFLIYSPGYFFPVLYTFLGSETKYYFEALTPLILRKAPREIFTNLISKNSESLILIGREIVIRLQELLERIEFLTLGNASQNVAFILSDCAGRFGNKSGTAYRINVPLVHKDIASMAGLTRETVSIEMKKFQDQGLISYRGKYIVIKNLEKFKQLALIGY